MIMIVFCVPVFLLVISKKAALDHFPLTNVGDLTPPKCVILSLREYSSKEKFQT